MKLNLYLQQSLMTLYDPRMENMIDIEGLKGLGAYWFIMEKLAMYPYSRTQIKRLKPFCKAKVVPYSYLRKIIENYGLFIIEEDDYFSPAELNPDPQNDKNKAKKEQKKAVSDAKCEENRPKRGKKVPENILEENDNPQENSDLFQNDTLPSKENTKDIITTSSSSEKEKEKSAPPTTTFSPKVQRRKSTIRNRNAMP